MTVTTREMIASPSWWQAGGGERQRREGAESESAHRHRQKNFLLPRSVVGMELSERPASAATVTPVASAAPTAVQTHQRRQSGVGGFAPAPRTRSGDETRWRRGGRRTGAQPLELAHPLLRGVAIGSLGGAGQIAVVVKQRLLGGAELAVRLGDLEEERGIGAQLVGAAVLGDRLLIPPELIEPVPLGDVLVDLGLRGRGGARRRRCRRDHRCRRCRRGLGRRRPAGRQQRQGERRGSKRGEKSKAKQ